MNMQNYGFNPMMMGGLFNPYGMQPQYPQLGGMFGGYNMGVPGQGQESQFNFQDVVQSLFPDAQQSAQPFSRMPGVSREVRAQPIRPTSGVAPGLFETDTPSLSPAPFRGDRTFVSGGVGKNAGATKQVVPGKPNFGNAYARTGEFGKKGLNTIQSMGYEGQDDFLAANPLIAKRYQPTSSPMKAAKPEPRYR